MSEKEETIFVGGVHGAGKSTLCKAIATQNSLALFTASELIQKASDDAIERHSKSVKDASKNQAILIQAFSLARRSSPHTDALLDGHFVIQSNTQAYVKIEPAIFSALQITRLICLTTEPRVIAERLQKRDAISVDESAIAELQRIEIAHANLIAETLELPLLLLDSPPLQQKASFSDGYTLLLAPPTKITKPFSPRR